MANLKTLKISHKAMGFERISPSSKEYKEALFIPNWFRSERWGEKYVPSDNEEIVEAYKENPNLILYRHFNKYIFRTSESVWFETKVTGIDQEQMAKMVRFFDQLKRDKRKDK